MAVPKSMKNTTSRETLLLTTANSLTFIDLPATDT